MPAVRRGPLVTLYWKAHRALYRLTEGRIGATVGGWPVLLLTTKGHRSGDKRDVTLNYLRDDDAYIVVGSYVGSDRDPAWWKNLKAHPDAVVLVDGRRIAVRARECTGAKRQLLWDRVVARDHAYAEYQRRTSRRIPVVMLEPVAS